MLETDDMEDVPSNFRPIDGVTSARTDVATAATWNVVSARRELRSDKTDVLFVKSKGEAETALAETSSSSMLVNGNDPNAADAVNGAKLELGANGDIAKSTADIGAVVESVTSKIVLGMTTEDGTTIVSDKIEAFRVLAVGGSAKTSVATLTMAPGRDVILLVPVATAEVSDDKGLETLICGDDSVIGSGPPGMFKEAVRLVRASEMVGRTERATVVIFQRSTLAENEVVAEGINDKLEVGSAKSEMAVLDTVDSTIFVESAIIADETSPVSTGDVSTEMMVSFRRVDALNTAKDSESVGEDGPLVIELGKSEV